MPSQILINFSQMSTSANEYARDMIEMTLTGMESGMLWANTFLRQYRKEQPLYCQPENLTLTTPQILDMLRGGVQTDSKIGQLPVGLGLLTVLRRTFPCPPQNLKP